MLYKKHLLKCACVSWETTLTATLYQWMRPRTQQDLHQGFPHSDCRSRRSNPRRRHQDAAALEHKVSSSTYQHIISFTRAISQGPDRRMVSKQSLVTRLREQYVTQWQRTSWKRGSMSGYPVKYLRSPRINLRTLSTVPTYFASSF